VPVSVSIGAISVQAILHDSCLASADTSRTNCRRECIKAALGSLAYDIKMLAAAPSPPAHTDQLDTSGLMDWQYEQSHSDLQALTLSYHHCSHSFSTHSSLLTYTNRLVRLYTATKQA